MWSKLKFASKNEKQWRHLFQDFVSPSLTPLIFMGDTQWHHNIPLILNIKIRKLIKCQSLMLFDKVGFTTPAMSMLSAQCNSGFDKTILTVFSFSVVFWCCVCIQAVCFLFYLLHLRDTVSTSTQYEMPWILPLTYCLGTVVHPYIWGGASEALKIVAVLYQLVSLHNCSVHSYLKNIIILVWLC